MTERKGKKPPPKKKDAKRPERKKGEASSGGKEAPRGRREAPRGGKDAPRGGKDAPRGGKKEGTGRYKSPGDNVYEMRVKAIRQRLDEIKQYKRILEKEGLAPDVDDKRIESELIIRLLRLEKQHAGPQPAKRPPPDAAEGKKEKFKRRKPRRQRQTKP